MSKPTDKSDTPEDKSARSATGRGLSGKAAIAGAAIGSAALVAALLYSSRRKDKASQPTSPPAHPEDAPETD